MVVERQQQQQQQVHDEHQRECWSYGGWRKRNGKKEEERENASQAKWQEMKEKKGGNEEFNSKKPDKSEEISGSDGWIYHLTIAMLGEEGPDLWKQRFEHDKVGRQPCSFGTLIVIGHRWCGRVDIMLLLLLLFVQLLQVSQRISKEELIFIHIVHAPIFHNQIISSSSWYIMMVWCWKRLEIFFFSWNNVIKYFLHTWWAEGTARSASRCWSAGRRRRGLNGTASRNAHSCFLPHLLLLFRWKKKERRSI